MRAPTRPSGFRDLLVISQVLLLVLVATAPAPVVIAAKADAVGVHGLSDKDFRPGSVAPSAAERSRAAQLGATVRWNRFGTPQSLIKYGGYLSVKINGTPEAAARTWIRNNRGLFKLSDADVTRLELVASNALRGTNARAVLFRQRFGNLVAAQDGLIIVGIRDGKVAYASSSASGSRPIPPAAVLTPTAAWLKAAASVGRPTSAAALSNVRELNGWTAFSATGLVTPALVNKQGNIDQRARLVAVPMYQGGIRTAYEAIVLDTSTAEPLAYTVFVDARSGDILMRYNRVDHAEHQDTHRDTAITHDEPTFGEFTGSTNQPNNCGIDHPMPIPVGTRTIDIVASATDPINDITIALANQAHVVIATNTETGTSPEALHYEFPAPVAAATTYYARVCQFNSGDAPFTYDGLFATNDVVSSVGVNYPPMWKYFRANPSLANDPSPADPYDLVNTDTRHLGCWVLVHNGASVPGCSTAVGRLQNLASRVPWDHNVQTNTSSFTTIGNNAISGEAWTTPLSPGPAQQRPVHLDRQYVDPWTNVWNQSRCNPTNVGGVGTNDIFPAATSLFVAHNRMHDWSYFLGFTEEAWNLQENNFGNSQDEHDPEYGQVQAGAALPVAVGLSRDNANQITLNDGVPGITNMYLWQPIAGAFYAPCVDGDYDMSVIGHEYTHAISNRMAGGPDSNLTGTQARAMGESWSDLAAVEYLNEFNLVPTNNESRYAVGPYVTGNKDRGIRNFNMSTSPLNYSNVGYDFVCNAPLVDEPILFDPCPDGRTQVHADGEIWSATNFALRQAFINQYNGSFPASNTTRQRQCAEGVYPASSCPGNRRWVQIMFDAWLLMPAAVSMLDARDAYLAADVMRFGGANQALMWKVFAQRGMGTGASTTGDSDIDPIPSFQSPLHIFKTLKFNVLAADEGNAPITNAKVYVGKFEAGVTPIADTIAATPLTDSARFVQGSYEFLVVAPGYGHMRFLRNVNPPGGNVTLNIHMSTNRASLSKGATVAGTGIDVANPPAHMFDDTEATNWSGTTPTNIQRVTVDLQGGVQNVKRVQVSALLNPSNGFRFSALRQFEIWTCNGNAALCSLPTNFTKIYTSAANAFPGVRPRPTAPDLIIRSFDVPDTNATHVQLRVVSSQCSAANTGFRGDQDADPLNNTDCVSGTPSAPGNPDVDAQVKAAELQVFTSTPALPPQDPAVVVTTSAPATVASGAQLTYSISYTNAGPNESANAVLTDELPVGVNFLSASNGGSYNASTRTVTWGLGTINVGYTGTRKVVVAVTAKTGTVLTNTPALTAALTTAVVTPAVTTVT